jgi:hypothetical protein
VIVNLPNPDKYKGRRIGIVKTVDGSTVTVRPISGDELQFGGTTYTNGSPLSLTSGTGTAYTRIEVLSLGNISGTGQWVTV